MTPYQKRFVAQHGVSTLLATGTFAAENDAPAEIDVLLLELAGAQRELDALDFKSPSIDEDHDRALRRLRAARDAVTQYAVRSFPRAS